MLIIQDQVWNRVTLNRNAGVSTWYYADEFHLLLKEPQTAAYSADIWKRFRKWGGVPTGATQNVKDILSSPEIENILENSDYDAIKLPVRSANGSAGNDFKAPFTFSLDPGTTIKIPTGIRVKIDEGWWLACLPRSIHGFKYRIQLDNTMGVQ